MTDRRLLESVRRQAGGAAPPDDVANDPRYLTALDTSGSELIVPVCADGRVVGTLDIEDPRSGAFDQGDQALFESLTATLTDLYAKPRRVEGSANAAR
jgi:putative methionine-R-sulfoxide reductase with GAF domain